MTAFQLWGLSGRPSKLDLPEKVLTGLTLMAVLIWVFPQATFAQGTPAINTTQLASEIKQEKQSLNLTARDIPGNKLNILKNYLTERNSPLQDYVEVLILQPNWKYVLAISFAESTMCQHQLYNNCWGIGGEKMRKYPSFAEGIIDANNVVQKYLDIGHKSTRTIMPYYVGWHNPRWVLATQQVFQDIKEMGI